MAADADELVDLEVEPTYKRALPLLVVPDSRARITTWPSLRRQPYFRAGAVSGPGRTISVALSVTAVGMRMFRRSASAALM